MWVQKKMTDLNRINIHTMFSLHDRKLLFWLPESFSKHWTNKSSCQSYLRQYMYQIYLLQESLLSVMQQLNQILSCEVEHCVNDFPFCHAFEKKNNLKKILYAHYSSFLYCTHAFYSFSSQSTTFQHTF